MGSIELIAIVLVTLFVIVTNILVHALTKTPNNRILAFYGIPALFLTATLLTPPDVISMLVLAVPASLLYSVAITVWIVIRKTRMS